MRKIITTSWDDGNERDWEIASLLNKYNLPGTFYIPKYNLEHRVISEKEIISLSNIFEIGGHSLNHINLKNISDIIMKKEINGCYNWLYELLNKKPESFCLPFGNYNIKVLNEIYRTGFKIIRTTNLMSPFYTTPLLNTTVQIYEHSKINLLKHLLKRGHIKCLNLWFRNNLNINVLKNIEYYIEHINKNGGCLHIWGHSWEIEENGIWKDLDEILKNISGLEGFEYLENKDLL